MGAQLRVALKLPRSSQHYRIEGDQKLRRNDVKRCEEMGQSFSEKTVPTYSTNPEALFINQVKPNIYR